MSPKTSARAAWCLTLMVAAYLALAAVAGVPRSPLTVPLPVGARPPSWATGFARAVGLDRVGRDGLIGIAWALVLVVLVAFAFVVAEAWSKRVRLSAALLAAGASLGISVAAPVLLSRDVYTYAAYGRVDALYQRDPYVAQLWSFRRDPFVAVTSAQWHHTHSVYGPAFTLASEAIARTWATSPGATILAFKLLAGLAIAAATGFAALAAARTAPERAPLAVALVGLNPVLVLHTVGGGHVDALIAAPVAAAAAIAVTRPGAASGRAFGVTLLLTAACLIKSVIAPALVLWVWWIARNGRRATLAAHLAMIVGLAFASVTPFLAGWHTLTPFATLGGVENWASPSRFVGRAAQAIAGPGGSVAVEVAFLLQFLVLLWHLGRRATAPAQAWGTALLLLALSLPFLLPWYAAWFAALLALVADSVVVLAGALVSGVLALTLIPADPFHGVTSRGVMDGVHYGAAPVLLVVLALVQVRVLGGGRPSPARPVMRPSGTPEASTP